MSTLATLVVKVIGDTGELQKSLGEATKETGNLGNTMSSALKGAAVVAIRPAPCVPGRILFYPFHAFHSSACLYRHGHGPSAPHAGSER